MTPKQQEALDALAKYGSQAKAAKALGITRSTFQERLHYAQRHLDADPAVKQAMSSAGMKDAGVLHSGWIKTDEASLYFKMPAQENGTNVLDQIKDYFKDLPAIQPVPPPSSPSDSDLLTVYPVPDAHIGMHSWGEETGEDYDTDIAVQRIKSGVSECVAASPASAEAVVVAIGDLLHADDDTNMTKASKHVLQVDGRHYKALDAAIYAIACAAEIAAQKHGKVTVVIQRGNHDPSAYMAVMFALAERYRENPRIAVQKHPGEFFVYQFGQCLIASQHGDKAKAERLVMHLADQWPDMWGATRHRYYFTGHLHHSRLQDVGGVQVEQLRAVCARDAYAASHAYSGKSEMQAITYHKDKGEVSRHRVIF
jgi:hypothetical protein